MKFCNNNVMIDLETLGTRPGCAILSIGAARFNSKHGIFGQLLYVVVNGQSCFDVGLKVEPETADWWESQGEEAKAVLDQAGSLKTSTPLAEALGLLRGFIWATDTGHPDAAPGAPVMSDSRLALDTAQVWSNGADFDLPILSVAYQKAGFATSPWMPYSGRCHRTLKNLFPEVPAKKFQGVKHNAVSDAVAQAEHAVDILRHLGQRMVFGVV